MLGKIVGLGVLLSPLGEVQAQLPAIPLGPVSVEVQTVASDFLSAVDLVSARDGSGRLFVVEQAGRIRILQGGAINPTPFLDVRAQTRFGGEQGLLGLAFHPGFSNSASAGFRTLYTFWTQNVSGAGDFTVPMVGSPANQCVVTEWKVSASNPNTVDLSTRRDVLRIDHPAENHIGGKIAFRASDGYLYIALGDGGGANDVGDGHTPGLGNGQDTTNLLGKILRIDPLAPQLTGGSTDPVSGNAKYRIPASNPFVGGAGLDEIYAYGFRNPYRFSFDLPTDRLIVGDVGQNSIEEVDIVVRGGNYGWNKKEGSFLFNPANGTVSVDPNPNPALLNPVLQYDHGDGISVIGGFVYRGSAIPALAGKYVFGDYQSPTTGGGRLFFGDLSAGTIQELRLGVSGPVLALVIKGFGVDDAGEVYALADNSTGSASQIFKIVPISVSVGLLNLSTRARVEADNNGVPIAGFIITGSSAKTVVLRALGPSLSVGGQPLPGRLTNPTLSLQNGDGSNRDANDDWMTHPRASELMGFGLAPSDSRESAIVATLEPGSYSAIMRGVAGATGIGLVELYDVGTAAPSNVVNLSTRGRVQTGNDVIIAGVIIGGSDPQRVLVRALGPSLSDRGVTDVLADPTLEIVNASGTRVAFNDDWRSDQLAEINATGLAPGSHLESAIVATLSAAPYTAVVRGANGTSGVALVEIYRLAP